MVSNRGFTMVELLVSMALLAVVTLMTMESFTVTNRAYGVIDQVAESQQNVRVVAALIEKDVRHAGMMVPEGAAVCGVDSTNGPDLLYVSDADAIDPGNDKATYDGARVQGGVNQVSPGSATLTLDSLIIEPSPPTRAAYDTDGDGTNDSDFQEGGGAIVMDLLNPGRGAACGVVDDVDLSGPSIDIDIVSGSLGALVIPSRLIVVPAHEYRVNGQSQLLRDGLLLAEGIEDLQVAYFFDADGDNLVDPGETRGDGVGANYDASASSAADLREVRVNLAARTRAEDVDFAGGRFQATENRAEINDADGYRRRVYTSAVMMRNVGNRI